MIKKIDENKSHINILSTYQLTNQNGMEVMINNVGCAIMSIKVADRKGNFDDVVLGFDTALEYTKHRTFFGCAIGRVANRIAGGELIIKDRVYQLGVNSAGHHLHGGSLGFDRVIWQSRIVHDDKGQYLLMSHTSPDGDEGYPGELDMKVAYRLDDENNLSIEYDAISNTDTMVNLTNHSFFNLNRHDGGDILDHELMINANFYTPVSEGCIPTGEIRKVEGTPLDFRCSTAIGKRINSDHQQLVLGNGYDHNYVLDGYDSTCRKAAEVYASKTGRVMEVFTTMPGVQLYTGNYLDGQETYKQGTSYGYRGGLCLETQFYPDSCHYAHFPSALLRAGERYQHRTIYKFSTR